jgi:hypothetical protein
MQAAIKCLSERMGEGGGSRLPNWKNHNEYEHKRKVLFVSSSVAVDAIVLVEV